MTRAQRFAQLVPLVLALAAVAGVWVAGACWSFDEQTHYARSRGFGMPWLLPLVLDGLAVSLAGISYAAALDGRAATAARAMTAVAVAASASSNAAWAWTRTDGDTGAVVLAAGVPVAANVAFEVLLSELRRQVHRRRGLPAAAPLPWPRLMRLVLAPRLTLREWRAAVLELTAHPAPSPAQRRPAAVQASAPGRPPTSPRPTGRPRADPRPTGGPDELATLGRQVAEQLHRSGRPLTRAALTSGVRGRGRSLSNERAGHLLALLRDPSPLAAQPNETTTTTGDL